MTAISPIRRLPVRRAGPEAVGLALLLGALLAAGRTECQEHGTGVALLIGVGVREGAAGFGAVAGEAGLLRGRWELRATAAYQRFLDPECPAPPPVVSCDEGGTMAADLIVGIRPGAAGQRHWSIGVGPGFETSRSIPYLTGLVSWETGLGRAVALRVEARGRALIKDGTHAEGLLLIGVGSR